MSPARTWLPQGRPGQTGPALRESLTRAAEQWLAGLLGDRLPGRGVALVALGGLGRRELTVASDLDLLLVHAEAAEAAEAAEGLARELWTQLWDAGVAVDHSTRTVGGCLEVAREDPAVTLALLDARHLAGDAELTAALREAFLRDLRRGAPRRLAALAEQAEQRRRQFGELAFLVEPELRSARGGLRDGQTLRAVAATWLADFDGPRERAAYELISDVRGALQVALAYPGETCDDAAGEGPGSESPGEARRRAGRREERLRFAQQPAVAAALGYPDDDALLAALAGAGRTLARALDRSWAAVTEATARTSVLGRRRRPGARRPLAEGVVAQDGRVVLAVGADPAGDPALLPRLAAAAAHERLPVGEHALERLAAQAPALPQPWPEDVRAEFLRLLGAGAAAIPVVEDLDDAGLFVRLVPEWDLVRNRPQRNPFHAFTVDRHLLETVAMAAAAVRGTDRPDLLLLGALFHDIGKGSPGDHAEVGAELALAAGERMGLGPTDAQLLGLLARHHLLLARTATRRDLEDPATAAAVAGALGSVPALELLHLLTVADGRATGPAAWSAWKADLVADLVRRAAALLQGQPAAGARGPTAEQEALLARAPGPGQVLVQMRPGVGSTRRLDVVTADHPGLLGEVAGVLTLAGLDLLAARTWTAGEVAVLQLDVRPRFGRHPDERRLAEELRLAVTGQLGLAERLAARARDYAGAGEAPAPAAPPRIRFLPGASEQASVLEVRAADRHGLLVDLAGAVTAAGVGIRSAHCATLGHEVVDTFYLEAGLDEKVRAAVLAGVAAALGGRGEVEGVVAAAPGAAPATAPGVAG